MREYLVESLFKFTKLASVNSTVMNGDGKTLSFNRDARYIPQGLRQLCLGTVKCREEVCTAFLVPVLATGPGDIEAMAAGIPTIVSDETGTKELVEKIDKGMVCRLDSEDLAGRISRYFGLSEDERENRSASAKEAAMPFSKIEQTERFRAQFERIAI